MSSNITLSKIQPKDRDQYVDDAVARLRKKLQSSPVFATEELREKYLELLDTAFIQEIPIDAGTEAIAFYKRKKIELYNDFFLRLDRKNRTPGPRGSTLKRMAKILAPELRHLTSYNAALPSPKSNRSIMNSKEHERDLAEEDANNFESMLWRRESGTITNF